MNLYKEKLQIAYGGNEFNETLLVVAKNQEEAKELLAQALAHELTADLKKMRKLMYHTDLHEVKQANGVDQVWLEE